MKLTTKWGRFGAAAVMATGLAFAQNPGAGAGNANAPHRMMMKGQFEQRMLDRLTTVLDLTADQQTQAKAIFDAAANDSKALAPQLRSAREALQDAVKAGNTANIDSAAAQVGQLTGKMIGIRAKARAQFYALLTPDQKAKADKLHSLMGPGAGFRHGRQ